MGHGIYPAMQGISDGSLIMIFAPSQGPFGKPFSVMKVPRSQRRTSNGIVQDAKGSSEGPKLEAPPRQQSSWSSIR